MTAKQKLAHDAQTLVRRIVQQTFGQKVNSRVVQNAARKVAQAVPIKKAA
jgi:hypothetical protein